MLILYVASLIAFSIFMHNVYRRYYKKQHAKIIEQNKKELELAKLQSEREIMSLKNKELKEDFKSKSKELAATTMSMIKKNEVLTEIRTHIEGIDNQKAFDPVLKIIDKSLRNRENWSLFKEAFDNVDSEFLKKIKELHPQLSHNDLKLCAYLRLNLSSKEIAPLFNISPRSVEIKRYRLRKKMDLGSSENAGS